MNRQAIETAIRDSGLPGRLVELDGKLVRLHLFNDRTERFEPVDLGISEFCDLVLDWQQHLRARGVSSPVTGPPMMSPAQPTSSA